MFLDWNFIIDFFPIWILKKLQFFYLHFLLLLFCIRFPFNSIKSYQNINRSFCWKQAKTGNVIWICHSLDYLSLEQSCFGKYRHFSKQGTLGLLTSKCAYFLSLWLLIFEMSGIFFLTLNDINIDLRSYARVIVFCFEAPSGVHFLNFWTKECRRLKFGENDRLISTSLCCFYVSSQSLLWDSLAA